MRNTILVTEHDEGEEITLTVFDDVIDGSDAVIELLAQFLAQREQAKHNRLYN